MSDAIGSYVRSPPTIGKRARFPHKLVRSPSSDTNSAAGAIDRERQLKFDPIANMARMNYESE
jgi:hypothetical protein